MKRLAPDILLACLIAWCLYAFTLEVFIALSQESDQYLVTGCRDMRGHKTEC